MAPPIPLKGDIPYIDPNVEHVGVSRLRELTGKNLRATEKTLVIQDKDVPLAVLLTYERYLILQDQLRAVVDTIEILSDSAEVQSLIAGLRDEREGRTKTIAEIRASLQRRQ